MRDNRQWGIPLPGRASPGDPKRNGGTTAEPASFEGCRRNDAQLPGVAIAPYHQGFPPQSGPPPLLHGGGIIGPFINLSLSNWFPAHHQFAILPDITERQGIEFRFLS